MSLAEQLAGMRGSRVVDRRAGQLTIRFEFESIIFTFDSRRRTLDVLSAQFKRNYQDTIIHIIGLIVIARGHSLFSDGCAETKIPFTVDQKLNRIISTTSQTFIR